MKDLFSLKGKKALVIGGAGGIGRALVKGFLEAGAEVSIADSSIDSLKAAQEAMQAETGRDVSYYYVDVTDEESVRELCKSYLKRKKSVDILVNAHGYNKKYPVENFPRDEWDKMFAVNVTGIMLLSREFGPVMKRQGSGKIINLSSVRGVRATDIVGNTAYCATKGAVDMLTRTLSVELGPEVNVNAIGPTITYTPMMRDLLPADPEERNRKFASHMPLRRTGTPEDLVGPAIFLASAASDFVTGQIIYPDGGLTAIG